MSGQTTMIQRVGNESPRYKLLKLALQLTLGGLLLAWILHAIFMYEGIMSHSKEAWSAMSKTEQWRFAWTQGPGRLAVALGRVEPSYLILSLVVMGTILLMGVVRWQMVLKVHGLKLPWIRAIEIGLVAHFFNSVLLGSAGGDVIRAIYAARETHHKKTEAVITVFMDRILGLWTLLLFGCVMMVPNLPLLKIHSKLQLCCWVVVGITVACTGVVFLALRDGSIGVMSGLKQWVLRLPKAAALQRALVACRQFGKSPWFLVRTLAISTLLNLLCVLHVQVLAEGLHMNLSLTLNALLVPVITALIAFPVTPSGIGMREYLFVYLLCDKTVGIDATAALSLSLLAYGGSLFWSMIGGVVYLTFKRKHHLTEIAGATADPAA